MTILETCGITLVEYIFIVYGVGAGECSHGHLYLASFSPIDAHGYVKRQNVADEVVFGFRIVCERSCTIPVGGYTLEGTNWLRFATLMLDKEDNKESCNKKE